MAVTIANIVSGISGLAIDPAGGRAFVDVGSLQGPVTIEYASEQEKVDIEQDPVIVKHLLKMETATLKANLAEVTYANFKNAYGYVDTTIANTGIVGPVVPVFAPQRFSAKITTTAPGALTTRTIILPCLHSTGSVGTPFSKGVIQLLPVEWQAVRPHNLGSTWVLNGTFTGNADNWTLTGGWAYGANAISAVNSTAETATQSITNLLAGFSYTLVFTITAYTDGNVTPSLGGTNGTARSAAGTYSQSIVAGAGNTNLVFTTAAAADFTIDNVYLIPDFVVGFQDA